MDPQSVSASSLAAWEECPAMYRATYIDRVPGVGKSPAADTGSVCHYALEKFVDAVYLKKLYSWSDKAQLDELVKQGFKKIFNSAQYGSAEFKDAQQMVDRWYERTDLSNSTVLSVERKVKWPLPASTGEIPLTYIMDRLDVVFLPDGTVEMHCVDYKGLALDTLIPTPSGFTTMGDIQVGDELYAGDSGAVCRVKAKSSIKHKPCYKLTFDDGTSVVSDNEHRWEVRYNTGVNSKTKVMTTEEIFWHLKSASTVKISVTHTPIVVSRENLPIDPYVFGAWIGDGTAANGTISKPLPELFLEIERRGYSVFGQDGDMSRTVSGLFTELRALGVLNNKHIPTRYLRASYNQRLDLLRGIMDTDGHWNHKRKRCVLNTTNFQYAAEVSELVTSLGWTANVFETKAHGFGKEWKAWQLWFTPTGEDVFLVRSPSDYGDKEYVSPSSTRPFRRQIKKVEPVDTVPTQCIEVDSPDHCFRFGRGFIKTHNTFRVPVSFDDLEHKLQAQIYALAVYLEYSKVYNIKSVWVHLDLLRHSVVGIEFSREQALETWFWLLEQVDIIRGMKADEAPEVLGSGCAYCPRKAGCESLKKHVNEGGLVGSTDLELIAKRRIDAEAQMKALKNLIAELDLAAGSVMQSQEITRVNVGDYVVEWGVGRGMRVIDASRAAHILGPEIMANVASLNIGRVDELFESGILTDDQKKELQSIISMKYPQAGVKYRKAPAPRKAKNRP